MTTMLNRTLTACGSNTDSSEEYWLVEGNWGWVHNTTGEHKKDESEWMEFENDDVPWEMMEDYLAQVEQLDLTFFETMRP